MTPIPAMRGVPVLKGIDHIGLPARGTQRNFWQPEQGFDHSDHGMLQEDIKVLHDAAVKFMWKPDRPYSSLTGAELQFLKLAFAEATWKFRKGFHGIRRPQQEIAAWGKIATETGWLRHVPVNVIKDYFFALTTGRSRYLRSNPGPPVGDTPLHIDTIDKVIEWMEEYAPHLAHSRRISTWEELADHEPGEIARVPEVPNTARSDVTMASSCATPVEIIVKESPESHSAVPAKPILCQAKDEEEKKKDEEAKKKAYRKRYRNANPFLPRKPRPLTSAMTRTPATPMTGPGSTPKLRVPTYSEITSAAETTARQTAEDLRRELDADDDDAPARTGSSILWSRRSGKLSPLSMPHSTARSDVTYRCEPYRGPVKLRSAGQDEAEWKAEYLENLRRRRKMRTVQTHHIFEIASEPSPFGHYGKEVERRILERDPTKTSVSMVEVADEIERQKKRKLEEEKAGLEIQKERMPEEEPQRKRRKSVHFEHKE